jgi:hypothetical protein
MTAPAVRGSIVAAFARSVTSMAGYDMFDEIAALVEELEGLGVKFTVVPRLDGSLRLNTWRTQNAWANRHRIDHLLAERIESAPDVAAEIAALIANRSMQHVPDPPAE